MSAVNESPLKREGKTFRQCNVGYTPIVWQSCDQAVEGVGKSFFVFQFMVWN